MARKLIQRYTGNGTTPDQGMYLRAVLDGKATPVMCCPGCGVRSYMSDHEVAADGTVNPSVGCPEDCGYHEYVTLVDWEP